MHFEKNFNKTCDFPDYIENLPDTLKKVEKDMKKFNEEYVKFRKKHGLENMYFSKIEHIDNGKDFIIEVWYSISDLYLTYLEANDILPKGAMVERFLIKEQYLYNTEKEWLFRDSIFLAMDQQRTPEIINGGKVYNSSAWIGLTERIMFSDPSNGLPGMIIDRIPMTYEDLIEK